MRKLYPFKAVAVALLAFFTLGAGILPAQCGSTTASGTACSSRSNTFFGEILPNSGCGVFTSEASYSPGTYFRVPVLAGGCYTVSTCGSSIDTQISCYQGGATSNPFSFNDDAGPDCSGSQASVNIVPNFTDYTRVDVREFNCLPGGSQSITVKIRQNNNLQITSSANDMCEGETRTLTATPAAVTGAQPSSGSSGDFSGTGVAGTTFTAPTPTGASQTYTIDYDFGYCSTAQSITVYANPSAAAAGQDLVVCDSVGTLGGTTPNIGIGTWSILSGPGTIASPNSGTSDIDGLVADSTTVLLWTVTNGPCAANLDTVTIYREIAPSAPVAGMDQDVCDSVATLMGNVPAVGNGSWSLVSGSGTIVTVSSATTQVTGLGFGPNVFRWTTSNGTCLDRTDDIVVTRDMLPSAAQGGPDLATCDTSAQLGGMAPAIGSGQWAFAAGSGSIVNPINPNTVVDSLAIGTNLLVWTVSNGACPANTDTVEVVRNQLPSPPAIAGDTSICEGGSAILTASSTGSSLSYSWWPNSSGGNPIGNQATFVSPPLTSPVVYWAEATDITTTCVSERTGISISILQPPSVSLGADQEACEGDTICLDAGPGQSQYLWSTMDTTQSICVTTAGSYWAIVTDTNNCQNADTADFNTLALPVVDLGADTTFCLGTTVGIGVGTGTQGSFAWSTGDTSSSINIAMSGTYSITVTDSLGCSNSDDLIGTALGAPSPGFAIDTSNCPVISFIDTSANASVWQWTFGDGNTGATQNQSNDYSSAGNGTYTVTLTTTNQCGTDSVSQTVTINCLVGVELLKSNVGLSLYPNPNQGAFRLAFRDLMQDAEVQVFDLSGKQIFQTTIPNPNGDHLEELNLGEPAAGMYLLRVNLGDYTLNKRVVVE